MGADWPGFLQADPLPALQSQKGLALPDSALAYWVQRDLLGDLVPPIETLWEIPAAVLLVLKQQVNGSWHYPGKSYDPMIGTNYDLLETYRSLRILVEVYGFNRGHPAIQKAADYIFSCQTAEGDVRGILGNQYMPYYHGAMLELLIKAGYVDDPRIKLGLDWLLSTRQEDGGWIVPAQAVTAKEKTGSFWPGASLPPDRSKPSSHLAMGMVLRAFAPHPAYRQRAEVLASANLLKNRLFQADRYNDRKAPSYWLKFQFPFWWTNLLTALDTLFWLRFSRDDKEIARGLAWYQGHQSSDGLWETGYGSGKGAEGNRLWVGLAVCRMLKNYKESG